jgi:[acyl-carrier-protein] S-malonyltransferase
MTLTFVFPGQGSQSIGMMRSLAQESPVIQATFAQASEVLGYDLWNLCQQGPEATLNTTECTQPAMLAAGVATYRLWRERGGPVPQMMAGHSLGEFSALVAAGSIQFSKAVALVKFRAEVMQMAVPRGQGAMAAILGLEDPDVEAACEESAQGEVVEAVNFNAPGQVVIAGNTTAVARAIAAALDRGARRAVQLPISVPAHSSLLLPAAMRLREFLAKVPVVASHSSAVYGVDVRQHSGAGEIRSSLVKQLHTPVYWASTVRTMITAGATRLIECGPGRVLTGLNRRIDKNRELIMLAIDDPKSLQDALASVGLGPKVEAC